MTTRARQTLRFLPALLIAVFGFPHAEAADWPVFHGPRGDNISPDTGLLQEWPENGPKPLWKADGLGKSAKPSSYAGVVVDDGRVFTTGNVDRDDEKTAMATLYCLEEATGKKLWQAPIGEGWRGHFEGDRGTPTVDGDRVYDLASRGSLTCFDVADGKTLWTRDLVADFEVTLPTWAYAQSVVIDGEKLIVGPGGKKASVVALDKTTGETVWTTPPMVDEVERDGNKAEEVQRAGYATPYLFEHEGRRMVAIMDQASVLIVDAKTGALLGRHVHKTKHDINATIPHYADGKLLTTSGYGTTGAQLFQVKIDGDKVVLEPVWQQIKFDNQHGGIVVYDGRIYGAAHNYRGGAWLCLNWEDGEIRWESRAIPQGSCTFADGRLYLYDQQEGQVVLLKASPEKFDMVGRFQIPQEGQGSYWAHPVVINKRLYLRHDTCLYCYDVAAP